MTTAGPEHLPIYEEAVRAWAKRPGVPMPGSLRYRVDDRTWVARPSNQLPWVRVPVTWTESRLMITRRASM